MASQSDKIQRALEQVQTYIRQGNEQEARTLLARVLKADPQNADGWYLVSLLSKNEEQQIEALRRTLDFNPQHVAAQQELKLLTEIVEPVKPKQKSKQPSKQNNIYLYTAIALVCLVGFIVVAIARYPLYRARQAGLAGSTAVPTDSRPGATLDITWLSNAQGNTRMDFEIKDSASAEVEHYVSEGASQLNYRPESGLLAITIFRADTSSNLTLEFITPGIQAGKRYSGTLGQSQTKIRIDNVESECPGMQVDNEFEIGQQSPQVVVGFAQYCGADHQMFFRGTVYFTPNSQPIASISTPTVVPQAVPTVLGSPTPYIESLGIAGILHIELSTNSPELIAKYGVAEIVFDKPALLTDSGFRQQIVVKTDENPAINWLFGFAAFPLNTNQTYNTLYVDSGKPYNPPAMTITNGGILCPKSEGSEFTVEEITPQLIVTFNQKCGTDSSPTATFRGKIVFTSTTKPITVR